MSPVLRRCPRTGVQPGVNFTYPGGKFSDAVVHFSTALVNKQ